MDFCSIFKVSVPITLNVVTKHISKLSCGLSESIGKVRGSLRGRIWSRDEGPTPSEGPLQGSLARVVGVRLRRPTFVSGYGFPYSPCVRTCVWTSHSSSGLPDPPRQHKFYVLRRTDPVSTPSRVDCGTRRTDDERTEHNTRTHTRAHTYTQTLTVTLTYTYTPCRTLTDTHVHTSRDVRWHTYVYTHIYTHEHSYVRNTHTYTPTQSRTHSHTHTHLYPHTRTHTYAHSHLRTH